MADDFAQITQSLANFDRPRLAAFFSCCVTAVSPMVRKWGTNKTQSAIAYASEILNEDGHKTEELTKLIVQLELLPESNEDDSLTTSYYVMRAIGVTRYCLAAIADSATVDETQTACVSLFDLARDVTFICGTDAQRTQPCDVAAKCTTELLTVIELLNDLPPSSHFLSRIEVHSQNLREFFEATLPSMVRVHRWQ